MEITPTFEAHKDDLKFRIKEHLSDGKIYLNVLNKDGVLIKVFYDYSVEFLKNFALDSYGIPPNTWKEMKFRVFETHINNLSFKIEEDYPEFGLYLFRYDEKGFCTHDYVQNTLEMCKKFALEEWGVPINSWIENLD